MDEIDKKTESETVSELNALPFLGYVPAMGQLHNKKPLKAISITALRAYWISKYKESENTGSISDRNRSLWWLIALLIYGSIDAYVDAELDSFPKDVVLDSLIEKNNGVK